MSVTVSWYIAWRRWKEMPSAEAASDASEAAVEGKEEKEGSEEDGGAPIATDGPVVHVTNPGEMINETFLLLKGIADAHRALVKGLGAGDSMIMLNVLEEPFASHAFRDVLEECVWAEMEHRGGLVPRRIAIQGTVVDGTEPLYRHPADEQPPLVAWTPAVERIKRELEEVLGTQFNHALVQHYRGGKDFIGEHADKTLDIARGSFIVNVSLGASRTMILRGKKFNGPFSHGRRERSSVDRSPLLEAEKRVAQRICMPHNSMFILGWESNRLWTHGIKQDKRTDNLKSGAEMRNGGERISLTFRKVATFRRQRDGQVYGQGARTKRAPAVSGEQEVDEENHGVSPAAPGSAANGATGDEDAVQLNDQETEALDMLQAFSAENRRGDFDWDKYYGRGFDVVNFRILNEA